MFSRYIYIYIYGYLHFRLAEDGESEAPRAPAAGGVGKRGEQAGRARATPRHAGTRVSTRQTHVQTLAYCITGSVTNRL